MLLNTIDMYYTDKWQMVADHITRYMDHTSVKFFLAEKPESNTAAKAKPAFDTCQINW